MKTSECIPYLEFMFTNRQPVLLSGAPGVGKTDMVTQAAANVQRRLIVSHPVVDDPTDYKGMPWVIDGKAVFLPFGNLHELIYATVPTVYFLDDLGQASPSVQSACMQLLLARSINGHKVSELVTFVAATNRRMDNANVSGVLEPVKQRFDGIIEIEYDNTAWVEWAVRNGMPMSLVSFMQFRPTIISEAKPSKDIVNIASPRTVSAVGRLINNGVDRLPCNVVFEAIKGAAGQAFAVEFTSFRKRMDSLPLISLIFSDPYSTPVPSDAATQYALVGAIADKLNSANLKNALVYLERMVPELGFACLTIAKQKNPQIVNNFEYTNYIIKHQSMVTA